MKEAEEFADEKLSSILKASARILPNQHFEDQAMRMIQAEISYKKAVQDRLKVSLKLFVGALLAGILLTLFILFGQALGAYTKMLTSLALFLILLFGITNMGNYRRLISKYT